MLLHTEIGLSVLTFRGVFFLSACRLCLLACCYCLTVPCGTYSPRRVFCQSR